MPLISERVFHIAKSYPDEIALTQNGRHWTYGTLSQAIHKAQRKLRSLGLKSGDKIALVLPNMTESVVLFYAANALGLTIVMLHPLSAGMTLKQRCAQMSVKAVFILDHFESRYKHHLDEFKVILVDASSAVTHFSKWSLIAERWILRSKHLRWASMPEADNLETPVDQPDAVVLFSSGTSGHQKAVSLSDQALDALVNQMEAVIQPERGVDSMFCVLPFFHGFGLGVAMHTVIALGGRCILVPRLTKNTVITTFLTQKPTYLAAVPYLLKILMKDQRFAEADLSFVKQVFVGGETVPLKLIEEFNALLERQGSKAKVQVGYGCTETVTAATLMRIQDSGLSGVGYPLQGNKILIQKEDGTEASMNESGEILISGPTLMNGYWGDPTSTETVLKQIQGDTFYRTGDIGHVDELGILHFHHRKDDLIKHKGFMIDPSLITKRFYEIAGINDVRVLIDDQDHLVAVLTMEAKADVSVLKKETIRVVNDLDGWMQPKRFVVIRSFPLNEMRKVDQSALREGLRNRSLGFLSEWSL